MTRDDWTAANRMCWDERVPIHVRSAFYDVDGFLAGATTLRPFERDEVGPVTGLDLVHLQCHFGLDTLSWAREGARVTGLDFSAPAIEAARELSVRAALEARWVVGDVHDAPGLLGGRAFDVVYTGLGAHNWLPDVRSWARMVASLLRPGGFLYLAEFHPFTDVFADDSLEVTYPYWHDEPLVWDDEGTYADLEAKTSRNRTFEWTHGLADVVTALLGADLRLELLTEHPFTLFERWPFLVREEGWSTGCRLALHPCRSCTPFGHEGRRRPCLTPPKARLAPRRRRRSPGDGPWAGAGSPPAAAAAEA
jgi:SAM-dependent methyltransferase